MKTFEPCQQTLFEETELQLTQSVAGSPAKTSHSLENELGLKVKGLVSGQSTQDLLARYDPTSRSWKTSQASCLPGMDEYSETWPKAGMTRSGVAYRLGQLDCLTTASVSGLLPTIVKSEGRGTGRNRYRGSKHYRGAKMAEGLRSGQDDPIYLRPDFAEQVMGFPIGWTDLKPSEMPSSPKSLKQSVGPSWKD